MISEYTPQQVDTVMDGVHRNQPARSVPWPDMAEAIGLPRSAGKPSKPGRQCRLERLYWGYLTGYSGPTAFCIRKEYHPISRVDNTGKPWTQADLDALAVLQLESDAQLRVPPVDVAHVSRILSRDEADVRAKLASRKTNHQGFGFV